MSQTVSAGLPHAMGAPQAESTGLLKSLWARVILTLLCAAVLWAAWAPLGHILPSPRLRVLLVLFVTVFLIWKVWPGLAKGIGNFQARLILTLIYAIIILPFGLLARLLADPLRIKKLPTAWIEHSQEKMDMPWAKRQ
ncbi:MAG TPA: hypothetical protein VG206_07555 [Terriglobia bacterium]|nr:hypothetical protein [Terriglobia bacterium]